MIKELSKEAFKAAAKEMLKDGSNVFATGCYYGIILATGTAGIKLAYTSWSHIYDAAGKGCKNLFGKIKGAKAKRSSEIKDENPEEPKKEE